MPEMCALKVITATTVNQSLKNKQKTKHSQMFCGQHKKLDVPGEAIQSSQLLPYMCSAETSMTFQLRKDTDFVPASVSAPQWHL